ncbi:MAG: SlyX family protein [Candidatus Omnitrophica bacterium]|nr:SlyX family protein [Candidatus Omnitrophota bacterium]MBU1995831.1 SlyX family protein [Candidatus Omnitrophota bacterium]MBU4332922.1 SlyX family protein [Candidatus Omnitrophota bacterium]
MEDRIIELEKKISFLEHAFEELQDVVFDQQKKIDDLEHRSDAFKEQLKNESLIKNYEDEEPPPHY